MKAHRAALHFLLGLLASALLTTLAEATVPTTEAAPIVITIQYDPGYSDAQPWGATISGDGAVDQWVRNIRWKNGVPKSAPKIESRYRIEPNKVASLLRLFEHEHFERLAEAYSANCTILRQPPKSVVSRITDQPTMKLTLSLGGSEQMVAVYGAGYIAHSVNDSSAPVYPYLPEVLRFVRIFAQVVGDLRPPNAFQTREYYLRWLNTSVSSVHHRSTCIESSHQSLLPTAQLFRSRSAAELRR